MELTISNSFTSLDQFWLIKLEISVWCVFLVHDDSIRVGTGFWLLLVMVECSRTCFQQNCQSSQLIHFGLVLSHCLQWQSVLGPVFSRIVNQVCRFISGLYSLVLATCNGIVSLVLCLQWNSVLGLSSSCLFAGGWTWSISSSNGV